MKDRHTKSVQSPYVVEHGLIEEKIHRMFSDRGIELNAKHYKSRLTRGQIERITFNDIFRSLQQNGKSASR